MCTVMAMAIMLKMLTEETRHEQTQFTRHADSVLEENGTEKRDQR
jgi:hypothetical protein